jgi:hypothetical protein
VYPVVTVSDVMDRDGLARSSEAVLDESDMVTLSELSKKESTREVSVFMTTPTGYAILSSKRELYVLVKKKS